MAPSEPCLNENFWLYENMYISWYVMLYRLVETYCLYLQNRLSVTVVKTSIFERQHINIHLGYPVLYFIGKLNHSRNLNWWNNSPSTRLFTVQTAFGLPGSSETAISDTSNPCLKTLTEDRGPRPHSMYSCGVSSLAGSQNQTVHQSNTPGFKNRHRTCQFQRNQKLRIIPSRFINTDQR